MPETGSRGFEPWELEVVRTVVRATARSLRALEVETVEDLIQECLLHWWQVRGQVVAQGSGPPVAYLARVVKN